MAPSSYPCSGLLHDTLGETQHDTIKKQRDLVETLETWLISARACLHEMERKHNVHCFSISRLPIKKCPPELLLEIFKLYLGGSLYPFGHPRIKSLLLVCRDWYQLVMDSPQLWARIELALEIGGDESQLNALRPYVMACLNRSKGLLLDVVLRFESVDDAAARIERLASKNASYFDEQGICVRNIDYQKLERLSSEISRTDFRFHLLSEIVGPQGLGIARWRSLEVDMPDYPLTHIVHDLFRLPAPNMTQLSVQTFSEAITLPLALPAVISLVVSDCHILSGIQVKLELLQHLELFFEQNLPNLSILSACRALRTLSISTDSEEEREESELCLPNLRVLTIWNSEDPFSTYKIKFPMLEKVVSYRSSGWDVRSGARPSVFHQYLLTSASSGHLSLLQKLLQKGDGIETLIISRCTPDNPDLVAAIQSAKKAKALCSSLRQLTVIAEDGTATPIDFLNM